MTAANPGAFERLIWWVVAGTRGGPTRARIIECLKERPSNASQLAERLDLDYKTVRHHIEFLLENRFLVRVGGKYGATYFLSPELEFNYDRFKTIWEKTGKTKID
jgi:DNA-binding transcriptional ArsR family regulator